MTAQPYGGWSSAISAASIAAGATALGELRTCRGDLYWLESRPTEGGRNTLLRRRASDGAIEELTPRPYDVRSRVHEYGGGAYLPTDAGVFFVDGPTRNLHRIDAAGTIHRLTGSDDTLRVADFCWDPLRQRLLLVSERHVPGAEPVNALQSLDMGSLDMGSLQTGSPETGAPATAPGDMSLTTLHQGHDFYAAPRLSPDGTRLAFIAWDHPNMPWDGSFLWLADCAGDGTLQGLTLVAGGAAESVVQPTWMADGGLVFASDANGYWNLYRYDASGLHGLLGDGAEYADPPWVFGQSNFCPLGAGHLIGTRRADQQTELVLIDVQRGFASPLDGGWAEYRDLCAPESAHPGARTVAFLGAAPDRAGALVVLPLDGAPQEIVARATLPAIPSGWFSAPRPIRFPTRDRGAAFGYYYPPHNPECHGPEGELPPLLVMTHGGPTAAASQALNLRVQYFTSRGFAVLDVDYRGSSGYGRAYRDALKGQWGILDVSDCEDGVTHLIASRLADPRRIAIRGGSAGGFTTLSALTRSALFGAGASHYGIGDLNALARDTHKFESRYLDALVGGPELLEQRSPIRHLDRLRCPVIFFQGSEDRIVPPNQATAMVDALRRRGLPVAYLEFAGEGHGFRRAASIEQALDSEYAFYCRVFGILPADPVPELEIINL